MIIVRLMGGLGNQMFQYATGLRLAQSLSVPLKLDLSWFESIPHGVTTREYQLAAFRVSAAVASREDIERSRGKLPVNLARLWPFHRRGGYVKETKFTFHPRILSLTPPVYLDGYWQSEKYFADSRDALLQEFRLKNPLSRERAQIAEIISISTGVGIHVRRGDYVTNPSAASFHGICPREYFVEAAAKISEMVLCPHFFIFSDDPEWVSQNLLPQIKPATIVTEDVSDSAQQDLFLMSRCTHFILSNSTFGWWGAWLGQDPSKVIIAPRRWFADGGISERDLVPDAWLRL
ncbi:GDP-Fuc:beta-D-Gal-1,3-alpha-D-GalNAc-1, 3-alpha-GalNAc-diphosphoundecaprenol alpha-1,2-fucosyltransferase [Anaerolineales bacterium]|nr:GDP-Fuc:beta-D-Gal-1,3-alpha-D-GalNAc-1, 3-alpha-GalNAc-diphosphoundecaprenol alpha-1,2-fucosyltransferase [Anaerolineales bacterium]